jgi:hypothetical protein
MVQYPVMQAFGLPPVQAVPFAWPAGFGGTPATMGQLTGVCRRRRRRRSAERSSACAPRMPTAVNSAAAAPPTVPRTSERRDEFPLRVLVRASNFLVSTGAPPCRDRMVGSAAQAEESVPFREHSMIHLLNFYKQNMKYAKFFYSVIECRRKTFGKNSYRQRLSSRRSRWIGPHFRILESIVWSNLRQSNHQHRVAQGDAPGRHARG